MMFYRKKKSKWDDKEEFTKAEYIEYIKERPECDLFHIDSDKDKLSQACKTLWEEGLWFRSLMLYLAVRREGRPCIWFTKLSKYATPCKFGFKDKEVFQKKINEGDKEAIALVEEFKRDYPGRYKHIKDNIVGV